MKFKQYLPILFFMMVLAQLFVPASMIWSKEKVLKEGAAYKFVVAPVDPNDPFRGKYIIVNIAANIVDIDGYSKWRENQEVYVLLGTDERGFAFPSMLSVEPPTDNDDYIKVKIIYAADTYVEIEYPFDRFYMEENKAYAAESLYFKSLRDTTNIAYALVIVNKGNAVLQDVRINDISIVDLVDQQESSEPLELH